jgi:hypothetical protein
MWSLWGPWDTVTTPSSEDTTRPSTSFYALSDLVLSVAQVDVQHVRLSWVLSDAAANAANAAENGKLRLGYGYSTSSPDVFFNGTYNFGTFIPSGSLKTVKDTVVELLPSQIGKECYFGITPVDTADNAAPALPRFVDTFTTVVPSFGAGSATAEAVSYTSFKVTWQPVSDTNVKWVTLVASDTNFYRGTFPADKYDPPAGVMWLAAKYPMSACSTTISALQLNMSPVYVTLFTSVQYSAFASQPFGVDTVYYPLDAPVLTLLKLRQVNDSLVRVDFRAQDAMENSIRLVTKRISYPVPGDRSFVKEVDFPSDASDTSNASYVNLAGEVINKGTGWTDQVAYIRLNAASLSTNRFLGTDDSVLYFKFTLSDLVPTSDPDTGFLDSVAIDRKGPSSVSAGVSYDRGTATVVCSVKTDVAGDLYRIYYGRSSSSYADSVDYVTAGSFVRFTLSGADSVFLKYADNLGNASYWSWRDFTSVKLGLGDFVGTDTSVDNGQVVVYEGLSGVYGPFLDNAYLVVGRSRLSRADSSMVTSGGYSMVLPQKYWLFTQIEGMVYKETDTVYNEGLDITFRFDEGLSGFNPLLSVYRVVRTGPSSTALEYVGGAAGRDSLGAYVRLEDYRMLSLVDTYTLVLAVDTVPPAFQYDASGLDWDRLSSTARLFLSVSDNTVDLDARMRVFTFNRATGLPVMLLDTATSALRGLSGASLSVQCTVTVATGAYAGQIDSAGIFCAVTVSDRVTRYFYSAATVMHDSLSGEFKLVENQWKLVSVPYAVGDVNSYDFVKDLTNFRGEYDRGSLRLYGEPGGGSAFREYGSYDSAFYVQPGRSFLLIVRFGDDVKVGYRLQRASQALPDKSRGYVFTGNGEWRLCAMPYFGRVRVSSVLAASVTARTDLSSRLYRLAPSGASFTAMGPGDYLPIAGDGFLAYLFAGERLVIPVLDDAAFLPVGKGRVGKADGSGWRVNLVVRERSAPGGSSAGRVLDNLNELGMGGLSEALLLRDLEMPGSAVRTGFAGKSGLSCVDRRLGGTAGEVFTWEAQDLSGEGKEAEAELTDLASVPAGVEVWLNDCAGGYCRDLRACKGVFAFVLKAYGKKRFEVVAGSKAYVQARLLNALPTEFRLSQNYPNPFNPVTTISFTVPDLSKEGLLDRTRLSLEIYGVRGVLARRIMDVPAQAGYYRVAWNGRDASGRSLATGLYFYRLRITDARGAKRFDQVRKMLLVK